MRELTISNSALSLRMTYNQVMRLVLRGDIRSRRTPSGRYFLLAEDVERVARDHGSMAPTAA